MLKIYLLLLLILSPLAQSVQPVITSLNAQYEYATLVDAEFEQSKKVKFISKPLLTTGRFIYAKSLGFIWQVITPLHSETLVSKNGIFRSNDLHKKQEVYDIQMQAVAKIMSDIFSGKLDKVANDFIVSERYLSDKSWEVRLQPNSSVAKQALKSLVLYGYSGIDKIVIIDIHNNKTIITLTAVTVDDKEINDTLRQRFDPY